MIERLSTELKNWIGSLEALFVEMSSRKVSAGFFEKKAEKLINEFWDLMQLIYDQDVLPEMENRILRGHSGKPPVIIDLFDPVSLFHGMKRKRVKYYQKRGYTVHEISGLE